MENKKPVRALHLLLTSEQISVLEASEVIGVSEEQIRRNRKRRAEMDLCNSVVDDNVDLNDVFSVSRMNAEIFDMEGYAAVEDAIIVNREDDRKDTN